MTEVLLTNCAHTRVAVEIRHLLSSWVLSLTIGRRWILLRLRHCRLPSLLYKLVNASLCGKSLTLVLDTTLQVEEHVHASLLRVVEPRGDLNAALVWRARQWASGHPPLPLVEPHGMPA